MRRKALALFQDLLQLHHSAAVAGGQQGVGTRGGVQGGGTSCEEEEGGGQQGAAEAGTVGGNARPSSINAPLRYLLISYLHLAP